MAKQNAAAKRPNATKAMLTKEHYDMIEATLQRLGQLTDHLDAAEACDVDCQEFREAQRYYIERLNKFKAKFFPAGRPK